MTKTKYPTLLIRLKPETRALLDRAAEDQRRTRVSLIEEAVLAMLRDRYASTEDRLNAMLRGAR